MKRSFYDIAAMVILALVPRRRYPERLEGVEAVNWRRGYFTKDRKDLPYPPSVAELERMLRR